MISLLSIALLFSVCITLLLWYFLASFSEDDLVKQRLKSITGKVRNSKRPMNLVKIRQRRYIVPSAETIKKLFPSMQSAIVFLIIWCIYIGLMFQMKLPFSYKIVLASVASMMFLRLIKQFTARIRLSKLRRDLPGAVDLLVICLEAGLGINAALLRVATELSNTPLGLEMRQMLNEISAGIPMDTALKNFAKRLNVPEVNSIVVAIIQAQKMGTSIAATCRVQSEALREQYKMQAKEKIMKLPVKMMIPLVFFIFPSLFVVILAPALLSIGKSFAGTGGN